MCNCKQCNTVMTKSKTGGNSFIHNVGTMLFAVIGTVLLVFSPIVGIILLLIALMSGASNKVKNIMLCNSCGYHFNILK